MIIPSITSNYLTFMNQNAFSYLLETKYPIQCTMAGIRIAKDIFYHKRRALPDYASFYQIKGVFTVSDEINNENTEDPINPGEIHTIAPGLYQDNIAPLKKGDSFLWFHFSQQLKPIILTFKETKGILKTQMQTNAPQKYICIPRHLSLQKIDLSFKETHQKLIQNIVQWGLSDFGTTVFLHQLLYIQHQELIRQTIPTSQHVNIKRMHVQRTHTFMQDHFSHIKKIEDVSSELQLNHSYLSRCFKEYTGTTMVSHLQCLRIQAAKEMIQQGQRNMQQIAIEVGIKDLNYFCRLFKKITGNNTREIN